MYTYNDFLFLEKLKRKRAPVQMVIEKKSVSSKKSKQSEITGIKWFYIVNIQ